MKRKAFTLVELLIVVVIIGILATLVTLALGSATRNAKNAKAKTSIEQVQKAVLVALNSADGATLPAVCSTGGFVALNSGSACLTAIEALAGAFSSPPVDALNTAIYMNTPVGGAGTTYVISGDTASSTASNKTCWYVTASSNAGLTTPSTHAQRATYCP